MLGTLPARLAAPGPEGAAGAPAVKGWLERAVSGRAIRWQNAAGGLVIRVDDCEGCNGRKRCVWLALFAMWLCADCLEGLDHFAPRA